MEKKTKQKRKDSTHMNLNPQDYILSPTHARRILNRAYTRWATKDLNPTLAMLWPPLAQHYDPNAPAIPKHLELPLLEIAESDGRPFSPSALALPHRHS